MTGLFQMRHDAVVHVFGCTGRPAVQQVKVVVLDPVDAPRGVAPRQSPRKFKLCSWLGKRWWWGVRGGSKVKRRGALCRTHSH